MEWCDIERHVFLFIFSIIFLFPLRCSLLSLMTEHLEEGKS